MRISGTFTELMITSGGMLARVAQRYRRPFIWQPISHGTLVFARVKYESGLFMFFVTIFCTQSIQFDQRNLRNLDVNRDTVVYRQIAMRGACQHNVRFELKSKKVEVGRRRRSSRLQATNISAHMIGSAICSLLRIWATTT